jgi:hypothetical protein
LAYGGGGGAFGGLGGVGFNGSYPTGHQTRRGHPYGDAAMVTIPLRLDLCSCKGSFFFLVLKKNVVTGVNKRRVLSVLFSKLVWRVGFVFVVPPCCQKVKHLLGGSGGQLG